MSESLVHFGFTFITAILEYQEVFKCHKAANGAGSQ